MLASNILKEREREREVEMAAYYIIRYKIKGSKYILVLPLFLPNTTLSSPYHVQQALNWRQEHNTTMSNSTLSEEQVSTEIKKMVEFIKKESLEKKQEIELKTAEEFEIEKSNIYKTENSKINEVYDNKIKQFDVLKKIEVSKIENKKRLEVLTKREDILEEILTEAEGKLKEIVKDETKYLELLKKLIVESTLRLSNEKSVKVKLTEADYKIVNKQKDFIKSVEKEVKDITKHDVSVEIIDSDYLPEISVGGPVVFNKPLTIKVDNTLTQRLKLLSENSLPQIKHLLFN